MCGLEKAGTTNYASLNRVISALGFRHTSGVNQLPDSEANLASAPPSTSFSPIPIRKYHPCRFCFPLNWNHSTSYLPSLFLNCIPCTSTDPSQWISSTSESHTLELLPINQILTTPSLEGRLLFAVPKSKFCATTKQTKQPN